MKLIRIVSGGQTGADLAALDAALSCGLPIGGWVPAGRVNEQGRISDAYDGLVEAGASNPNVRTTLNVRDSDATLIFSHGPLIGGSAFTKQVTGQLGKPCLHVDFDIQRMVEAEKTIKRWIERGGWAVLNVAGPRASEDPQIYDAAYQMMMSLLSKVSLTELRCDSSS